MNINEKTYPAIKIGDVYYVQDENFLELELYKEYKKLKEENEKLKIKKRKLQHIVDTYFWNINQAGFNTKKINQWVANEIKLGEKLWRTQKHCQEAKIEVQEQRKYNEELLQDKIALKSRLKRTEELLEEIKWENKDYEERLKELDRLRKKEKEFYTVYPLLHKAEAEIRHLKNEIDIIHEEYMLIKRSTIKKREADDE